MDEVRAYRVLVPVGESDTLRQTVAHVLREALEATEGTTHRPSVHFVFAVGWQRTDPRADTDETGEALFDRIDAWIREDIDVDEDDSLPIDVTTDVVGADQYLFSPGDYAEVLLDYARENGIERMVLDPEFRPGARAPLLTSLETELSRASDVGYETAPVERRVRGRQLLARVFDLGTFASLFGISYLFYLVLGGFAGTFDLVTGAISAAIVAFVLSGVTFERAIRPGRVTRIFLRWVLYVPYLFWEIAKANVGVAYVVLHPSLPIEPSVDRFRPAVPRGLPVTTLANSITLTPGTVTVDVQNGDFLIHSLTRSSRDGLFDGGLERAVRFVFFGREAARIASPRERGQEGDPDPEEQAPAEHPEEGDGS